MANVDKKKFDEGYAKINWTRKVPKTFKTSWGAEYTLMLKQDDKKDDVTPTIGELVSKSRKDKSTDG